MVGSTFPISFSLPVADTGAAAIVMHVDGRALAPRRNGWTSRAARARSGLMMAAHSAVITTRAAGDDISNSGNSTDGPSPVPAAAAATRAPASVPIIAITCSAVGGVVVLAIIFALVYVRRIKRRVKSMKRRTNVLGPELAAPMSPSQMSQSTIDSPRVTVKPGAGVMPFVPPRRTSDMMTSLYSPPLSASFISLSSPTGIERPTSLRHSTIILSPPPAAKRPTIQSPDPRSSHVAVPWPLVTSGSWSSANPRLDNEKCNSGSGSDTSEPHAHK